VVVGVLATVTALVVVGVLAAVTALVVALATTARDRMGTGTHKR
jgi:hypothetical protein